MHDTQTLRIHRSLIVRAGLCAILTVSMAAVATPAAASGGAHWCEFVEYVKNYFGLRGAAGNAGDMGPFLAAHGFKRSDVPAIGDVVVIQPAFYAAGEGSRYGHVTIIESLAPAGSGGWFLGLRGANQTGKQFSGADCANVTFKSIGPVSRSSRLLSYWVPARR